MYRIKQDKRVEKSAELIVNGLYQCVQKKDFDKITFSDISKSSGVIRSTIYRLFDLPLDILKFDLDQTFQEIIKSLEDNPHKNYLCIVSTIMDGTH